jgi:hypothetical protein
VDDLDGFSLACRFGRCQDCPDDRAWDDACPCGCHIPPDYQHDDGDFDQPSLKEFADEWKETP